MIRNCVRVLSVRAASKGRMETAARWRVAAAKVAAPHRRPAASAARLAPGGINRNTLVGLINSGAAAIRFTARNLNAM